MCVSAAQISLSSTELHLSVVLLSLFLFLLPVSLETCQGSGSRLDAVQNHSSDISVTS